VTGKAKGEGVGLREQGAGKKQFTVDSLQEKQEAMHDARYRMQE